MYLLALLAGFVNAIEMPVRQAFAAELVPSDDLVNAIALNSTSFNLSRVIGPAIAGVTIAAFGVAINFGINAVSYLFVLIALWMLDSGSMRHIARPDRFPSIRASLAEGVRYAIATPTVLWPLVLLGGMATFAMNFQTLLPLFTRDVLNLDSGGYGALFAAMGAGSLVGSLILAFATSQRPMLALILGGGAVFLVLELALGFVRSPLAAVPARGGHRSCLDADGEHHQRHDPEQRAGRPAGPGDGALRDRLRRHRPVGRPAGRSARPGLWRRVRHQHGRHPGGLGAGAGGLAAPHGPHAAQRLRDPSCS